MKLKFKRYCGTGHAGYCSLATGDNGTVGGGPQVLLIDIDLIGDDWHRHETALVKAYFGKYVELGYEVVFIDGEGDPNKEIPYDRWIKM